MRRIAPLLLLLCVPLVAQAKEKKAPAPSPASVWEPLVMPGARFVLLGGGNARIVVESYDARVIKGAKVARLRWVVEENGTRSPMGNSLPTQIAVTKKGAFLLTDRMDDKGIAEALRGKPSFTDPPRASEGDDGYVRKDAAGVCIGVGTPPGKPCAAGICHAEYCLAPGVGLTAISGNYTPSAGSFIAPKPNEPISLDLRTGVVECDEFLNQWARCVQEVLGPDLREQLNDALKQMAEAYRQQAATPEGAKQAADVCREVAPQMNEALRGMGCKI
jgi:hypothetical protein